MSYFDEDYAKVSACKGHSSKTDCHGQGTCYYELYTNTACSGANSLIETIHNGDGTAATCGGLCASNPDCNQFWIDTTIATDTASKCKIYTGTCTYTYGATDGSIYQAVPCCYWTSPTELYPGEAKGCTNDADATINGSDN